MMTMTDDDLRQLWTEAGGTLAGPNARTGSMREACLLSFIRQLLGAAGPYLEWSNANQPGEEGPDVATLVRGHMVLVSNYAVLQGVANDSSEPYAQRRAALARQAVEDNVAKLMSRTARPDAMAAPPRRRR